MTDLVKCCTNTNIIDDREEEGRQTAKKSNLTDSVTFQDTLPQSLNSIEFAWLLVSNVLHIWQEMMFNNEEAGEESFSWWFCV